jgi:hypothetical protein
MATSKLSALRENAKRILEKHSQKMAKGGTVSNILKVNIGYILLNYSNDFTREKYNSLNDYIENQSERYISKQGIEQDMTKEEIKKYLSDSFKNASAILTKSAKEQKALGNKELAAEMVEAKSFYIEKQYAKGGTVKEIEFENSNLYLYGGGTDSNGNHIVKVGFPNAKAFSIQTNGVLPNTNRILKSSKLNELDSKEIASIEKEVVGYVKEFGSKEQKAKLKVYSQYAKGGELIDCSNMSDWQLEERYNFFLREKEAGNFDENTMNALISVMSEINKRQGEKLKEAQGGEMYEHGGEVEHHNLNVFGYETKHFTKKAHDEFEAAIAKIEEQHLHAHFETKKEALRKCAEYLDKIFASTHESDTLTKDIQLFAINNYRSDLHISMDIADSHLKEFKEGGEVGYNKYYYLQYGIGKSKYVISFWDGIKRHKDNSEMLDVSIFSNKKDVDAFQNELLDKGYKRLYSNFPMEKGGELGNKEMVANKATEIAHHAKELHETLEHSEDVPAWVVSKIQRSATDIADVAHYLEGEEKEFGKGGELSDRFEVGTPAIWHEKQWNGEVVEVDGEIVMKDGVKKIKPYKNNRIGESYVPEWENVETFYEARERQQNNKPFVVKDVMAKGGETFASKTKAVASRLSGDSVPAKYQKTYGKKYSPKEAKEAAARIIGAQVAKSKMAKGGELDGYKLDLFSDFTPQELIGRSVIVKRPLHKNRIAKIISTTKTGFKISNDSTNSLYSLKDGYLKGGGQWNTNQCLLIETKMDKGGELVRKIIVSDINNGKIINDLYTQWDNIKSQKDWDKWAEKVKSTKFGTYGTISFDEVLEKFDYKDAKINDVLKKAFPLEIKRAIGS